MSVNNVQYWLKDRHDVYVQLPVNPVGVSIATEYGVEVVDVLALGQVSSIEQPKLREFSLEVLFPRDYNPSYCEYEGFMSPMEWFELIEGWRETRRNIRVIVTGANVSIPVYIKKASWEFEKAGMPGDLTVTLDFVEAAVPKAQTVATRDAKGVLQPPKVRPDDKDKARPPYVVFNAGDSLYKIANKYYGNGGRLIDIYNANRDKFPKGLASAPVGERLRLP